VLLLKGLLGRGLGSHWADLWSVAKGCAGLDFATALT
jgi:hypothetical protein